MLFQSLRTRFFAYRLQRSLRHQEPESFARLVAKGLQQAPWQPLITPSLVAAGAQMMAGQVDHEEKASSAFVHMIRTAAAKPELLQEIDDDDVETLLTDTIADDKLGTNLARTLGIFAQAKPVTIANTLHTGISLLMDSDETPNDRIAQVIMNVARSPLCQQHEMFATALHRGVADGAYLLAQGGYMETAADIFTQMHQHSPAALMPAPLKQAMLDGTRSGLLSQLADNPLVYFDNINTLITEESPLLDAVTDKDVCQLAIAVLRNRDIPEERCEVANVLPRLKEVPRFAFALGNLPELNRMVVYTTEEMGTGYPMVVEARPDGDIAITTGCRVNEPPYSRIEAWLDHRDNSRRESAIPRVFEAVAALTACPYPRQAAAAQAELAALGQLYEEHWQHEGRRPFSAAADARIRTAVAKAPALVRPDLP